MLCSPDTRRNSSVLYDEYPVILDALILHIFRKFDCMHDARIQPIKYSLVFQSNPRPPWPSKLFSFPGVDAHSE
jgi:hypothetical protein